MPHNSPTQTLDLPSWASHLAAAEYEDWLQGDERSLDGLDHECHHARVALRQFAGKLAWQWPERPIVFIADPHADAEAFEKSLVASQTIEFLSADQLILNQLGRESIFIIGGDCLDKGPSNLDLLDSVKKLRDAGATLHILAGNHDVRLLMGLQCLEQNDTLSEHMFLRMGAKIVPLLEEVYKRFVVTTPYRESAPSNQECERFLFPSSNWFKSFPELAKGRMSNAAIKKEVERLQQKIAEFRQAASACGMDMQALYATAKYCQQLFMHEQGDYAWFFQDMTLSHQEGSFLFLHAGLDDQIAQNIQLQGCGALNEQYKQLCRDDLFAFYYGPVANTMRTKYRSDDDFRLSDAGVQALRDCGIHAVVHGHQNRHHGQRIFNRQNLLHFECDTTLDRNSRKKEGLQNYGVAATLILPQGQVLGLSCDHPKIKAFNP